MNSTKIISGHDLVAKGATKIEATLPEVGLKNSFRNNTWLEDKQIQSALEARKHLVEVERIEKSGVLSHGVWREELMLVEVTKKVGGYWQYMGHNVGKILFLKPEEALFLMEVNCLCLKHNDVKVSLQQAYILLLRDKITLYQYKVYAFLSRLGYRLYRYENTESTRTGKNTDETSCNIKDDYTGNMNSDTDNSKMDTEILTASQKEHSKEITNAVTVNKKRAANICMEKGECSTKNTTEVIHDDTKNPVNNNSTYLSENLPESSNINLLGSKNKMRPKNVSNLERLQKLKSRHLQPCNNEIIHKYFDSIPELINKTDVRVKAPAKKLIPNTIVLNNPNYQINIQNVRNKRIGTSSNETNIYSPNDEANGSHIRRLRNTSINNRFESNSFPPTNNIRFGSQYRQNQQFQSWRMRRQSHFYHTNMSFQTPFTPGWFYPTNYNFYQRFYTPVWQQAYGGNSNNVFIQNNRKRNRKSAKKQHLDGIYKLAARLKQIIRNGNAQHQNVYALQRLISTYNARFKTKVRLSDTFDIIIDETIVDTIELDDDEGPSSKKRRTECAKLEENLNNLKQFASRLKELERDNKSSGRHRRAFSKLLKTFNECYNEDYSLNVDYELVYKNRVDLDSSDSSDLDCTVQSSDGIEEVTPNVAGKKLKNPFNILKRLSENHKDSPNSSVAVDQNAVTVANFKYSQITLSAFKKNWLPPDNDFGRAEIMQKDSINVDETAIQREEFLYDFLKIQTRKYENWLDLKKSYFSSIEAAITEFQGSLPAKIKRDNKALVKPEDCVDMESVLNKLSIIKNVKNISQDCNLKIDFDVYKRDVKNFRKTNRPLPHFRIICLKESTKVPTGEEIASLHSQYADQVTIVFAIVGVNAISFVQIKPSDLPVYISNNT